MTVDGRNQGHLFRIGFGSGMLLAAVNLASPAELRQKIRDAYGSGRRPGDPAPNREGSGIRVRMSSFPWGG